MPIPLSSNEIIHVDHKIKDASYSMPHMQAASDQRCPDLHMALS